MAAEKLIILGAPGSGKGTQAAKLAKHFGIPHLSTGDILREEARKGSMLGMQAKVFMDKGSLIPDGMVIGIMEQKLKSLARKGFLLDGFPRTFKQAMSLDRSLNNNRILLNRAIYLEVPDEVIVNRIIKRQSCADCGEIFHLESKPTVQPGICDKCGGKVETRTDDNEETVRNRLEVFHSETKPLLDYYNERNLVIKVSGEGDMEEIFQSICRKLKMG